MSTLQKLQDWYRSQCDEDWEHSYGVKIDTLDNPGWSVTIDLDGTSLEEKTFSPVAYGIEKEGVKRSDDWLRCYVEKKKFIAHGGPHKLDEMLQIFLRWKEEPNQALQPTAPSGRG